MSATISIVSLLVLVRALAMFSRKDKSIGLADDANNNTQHNGPSHSAIGAYGLKKCHDPAEAIAECVLPIPRITNNDTLGALPTLSSRLGILTILLLIPASSSSTA